MCRCSCVTEDLSIDVDEQSPEGSYEKNRLQTGRRVSIPPDHKEHLDIEVGDAIFILLKEDSVEIFTDISKCVEAKEELEE